MSNLPLAPRLGNITGKPLKKSLVRERNVRRQPKKN